MTRTADRPDTATVTATKPFVVISADTHVGTSRAIDFAPYLDPAFRKDYEELCSAGGNDMLATMRLMQNETLGRNTGAAEIGSQIELDDDDPVRKTFRKLIRGFGVDPTTADEWAVHYTTDTIAGGGDSQKRLKFLEGEGVVAEVCIPGGPLDAATPMRGIPADGSPFMWARMQAYNRWLKEFCEDAPGRRAGVVVVNAYDLDATVAEIRWARNAGLFGGIMLPPMSLASGNPGYADPYWYPLWDICDELDMVVNCHVGTPLPDRELYGSDEDAANALGTFEHLYFSRRAVWHMIFGSVFDMHPNLKVSVIENRQEWVQDCIDEMDIRIRKLGTRNHQYLNLAPAEYFERNVFFGASTWNRKGVEGRDRVGIDHIMWGTDYPHPEGATPFLKMSMQYLFGGIPEPDVRKMLGENAARIYGFDLAKLGTIAETCGPTVEEMAVQLPASAVPANASPVFEEF